MTQAEIAAKKAELQEQWKNLPVGEEQRACEVEIRLLEAAEEPEPISPPEAQSSNAGTRMDSKPTELSLPEEPKPRHRKARQVPAHHVTAKVVSRKKK